MTDTASEIKGLAWVIIAVLIGAVIALGISGICPGAIPGVGKRIFHMPSFQHPRWRYAMVTPKNKPF